MLARIRKAAEDKDSGFTLIELLVVMIIIGILAAIAIPAFLNQKKKANETAAKSDATNISKELSAALVDGPFTVATAGTASPLKYTNATVTDETVTFKLSAGNTISWKTVVGSDYCVTVKTVDAVEWSAGPLGLKKGATCPV